MHYLALVCPVAVALAVVGAYAYQQYCQQHEREEQYWSPFRQQRSKLGPSDASASVLNGLLVSVEAKLRDIRTIPPGPQRSKKIRELRAEYHADRFVNITGDLKAVFQEVSRIVNSRTEGLL